MSGLIKSADINRAKNGSLTMKVHLETGNSIFLHSMYNPEAEAQEWLKNIKLQSKTAYVVLGVGLAYHIKALLAVLPKDSHIFSIESPLDGSFINTAKKVGRSAAWASDKRFTPLIGNDIHDMSGYINKSMQRNGMKRITICRHFPTMQIHSDFYERVERELVTSTAVLYAMDYSYQLAAGERLMTNAWSNLPQICHAPGIEGLKDKFKGLPAIMVAGGPSLDKNIHILKEYADKAIIICAGSTMGTLHHYGITPHFLVAVDPYPTMVQDFEGCLNEDTYLVAAYTVPNDLITTYPGPKLFCRVSENSPNGNALNGVRHLLPEASELHANISVATTALSLAIHIGANPIILVGQDLAVGNEKATHATGSKATSYFEMPSMDDSVKVPGYYGGEVKTYPIFKVCIDYYATFFEHIKNHKFINATEGGAYLPGAEHTSLKQVADQYLSSNIDVFSVLEKNVNSHKINYDALCGYLRECVHTNDKLLEQAEALMVATDQCPSMILAGDVDGAEQALNKMDSYFTSVRNSPAYIHLITYLSPIMQSFYSQEQYTDLEEKFLNYVMLFVQIRKALERVNELMSMALDTLQKDALKG